MNGIDIDSLIKISTPNFSGSSTDVSFLITTLIPYVYSAAGFALIIYFLMGAFSILTSGGNPQAVQAGKNKITYALVGFLVVFFSFWIVQLVGLFFGISIIGEIFTF